LLASLPSWYWRVKLSVMVDNSHTCYAHAWTQTMVSGIQAGLKKKTASARSTKANTIPTSDRRY
jgi:hypothetical protein